MDDQASLGTAAFAPVPHTGGYQDLLGYETKKNANGDWIVELILEDKHLNHYHIAHGGIPLALLDTAGGAALYSNIHNIQRMATISLNTNFIKGAQPGLITAIGRVEKSGGTVCFTSMSLHQGDENGPLLATAQGSYRIFLDDRT